jgi:hypothetical protein
LKFSEKNSADNSEIDLSNFDEDKEDSMNQSSNQKSTTQG